MANFMFLRALKIVKNRGMIFKFEKSYKATITKKLTNTSKIFKWTPLYPFLTKTLLSGVYFLFVTLLGELILNLVFQRTR